MKTTKKILTIMKTYVIAEVGPNHKWLFKNGFRICR